MRYDSVWDRDLGTLGTAASGRRTSRPAVQDTLVQLAGLLVGVAVVSGAATHCISAVKKLKETCNGR